jgi:hypothetical protein
VLALVSSIGGLLAVIIAVGNGIWQDSRQRRERRARQKEEMERMLQDKAEEYCGSVRNLISRLMETQTMLSLGKADALLATAQTMIEDRNNLVLLEAFQLAFLTSTVGSVADKIKELIDSASAFADSLPRSEEIVTGTVIAERIKRESTLFEGSIAEGRDAIFFMIDRIPNLDLYRLYVDWRKKHPIR